MKVFFPGISMRAGLIISAMFIPGIIFCQYRTGKVISGETGSGIGYVNIGIIGKNIGTVSDGHGNFSLLLDKAYDNDSLRFSMIGYESRSFLAGPFRSDSLKDVILMPKSYDLPGINVIYQKPRNIRLGTEVLSDALRSGFAYNTLGSELGVKIHSRKKVVLQEIKLNVAICTYDSVTYRLNIYKISDKSIGENILTTPIYVSFTKNEIDKAISFDISKYAIMIEGDVMIALELYRDLGEGRLLFRTEFFTGSTYHRKAIEGNFTEAAGVIGLYLHCHQVR
jgi:hypothetical protein